jgi:ribonuclease HII
VRPEYLLIDGPMGINYPVPQKPIKKGDALSVSISAASIIAKVTRDRMMCELEREYPNFRFSIHKGYGTELHLDELRRHGPTAVHRKTFRGVI